MKKGVLLIIIFLLLFSCNKQDNNLFNYVNPFIGTGGHGHTYPGVSQPFGVNGQEIKESITL